MLLLLDNLEHLLAAAPELSAAARARARPDARSSLRRELLRLRGETSYELPPLAEDEGVALFCERAAVEPSTARSRLCRASTACRSRSSSPPPVSEILSPAQILDRLSQRLDLLKGGRDTDPRQQTLRATMSGLTTCSPPRSRPSSPASVFAGGCTLEAAEEVARPTSTPSNRSSTRASYASRASASGCWRRSGSTRQGCSSRRASSTPMSSEKARDLLRAPCSEIFPSLRKHSPEALAAHDLERDNMRVALEFALRHDRVELASERVDGLWFYWLTSGHGRRGTSLGRPLSRHAPSTSRSARAVWRRPGGG